MASPAVQKVACFLQAVPGPLGHLNIQVRKTKPRRVVDVRWKGRCSFNDLIRAIRNFEARRADTPDVIRVAPEMKAALEKEARSLTASMTAAFGVPPALVSPAKKGLTFMGVKVTL